MTPHPRLACRRPNSRRLPLYLLMAGLALGLGTPNAAWAQSAIYTCVDAQGRRITSDRPIAACMDREQRELSPSGSVKRVIPPVPTAQELQAQEAQQKETAAREARAQEERRKERALLSRYPNEAAHQRERAKAQESVDAVEKTIQHRIEDLVKQRARLDEEMAFYARDPNQAPASLKRKIKDTEGQISAQQAALQQQGQERQRLNERFDAELQQLRKLWAQASATAAEAPTR